MKRYTDPAIPVLVALALLALSALASFGCTTVARQDTDAAPIVFRSGNIMSLVYSPDLESFAPYWCTEAQRRYSNCIVVMAHGFDMGEWWCQYGDSVIRVELLIHRLQGQYPGRRIVIVVCNPGGYDLQIPGVTHTLTSSWAMPDRAMLSRSYSHPRLVGNIFELDED